MSTVRQFTAPTRWAGALINGNAATLSDEDCAAVGACIESLIQKHGNDICFDREDLGGRSRGYEHYGKGPCQYSIYCINHTLPAQEATP